jgi:hypothetical protein
MLETFGVESGLGPHVTDPCRCSPTTTPPNGTSLPSYCYSPDGSNCRWYSDCLEARYPCSGSDTGYAIEYALRFCRMYQNNYADFSPTGQRWIDAVRKCLQVKLVPLIRQYTRPSCSDIRQRAFDTHAPCYLNPYAGAPSICDLPPADIVPLIFTLQSAFTDITTVGETVCGALDVAKGCNQQWAKTRPCVRAVVVSVKLLYSTVLPKWVDKAIFRTKLALKIAELLGWESKGIRYLGCAADLLDPGNTVIGIMAAVSDYAGCIRSLTRRKRSAVSVVDLDAIMAELRDAVGNGSLVLNVDGRKYYATSMSQCDPPACSNGTRPDVVAPPPPEATTIPNSAISPTSPYFVAIYSTVVRFLLTVIDFRW